MMKSILVTLAEKGEVAEFNEQSYPTKEYLKTLDSRHIDSPECWCFPTLNYVHPDTEQQVWVHHQPH